MQLTRPELLTFDAWRRRMVEAEQGDGWLVACEAAGRHLAPCRELIDALADLLGSLVMEVGGPVLEICAGCGELAAALSDRKVPVVPIDVDPPAGGEVLRMSAEEALERYRPAAVLGAFVPVDSGVDEAVMRCPTVRHYVVLGVRLGGLFGSASLWHDAAWKPAPLDGVGRWMLTRHDVWLGGPGDQVIRHGEAWHFRVEG
jgi:hypothetical protein